MKKIVKSTIVKRPTFLRWMHVLSVKKRRILVVVFKLDECKIVSLREGAHFFVIILARQPRIPLLIIKASVHRRAEKEWAGVHLSQSAQEQLQIGPFRGCVHPAEKLLVETTRRY